MNIIYFLIFIIININLKELSYLLPLRMLGVAIGLVSSIVIFVFYGYDKQAV